MKISKGFFFFYRKLKCTFMLKYHRKSKQENKGPTLLLTLLLHGNWNEREMSLLFKERSYNFLKSIK